ncbi:MAG TPA: hypothetical protein VJA25_02580 [Dehalococcoidia bacterium]|nr:hypothetical protein [Dehalococcoidia bacterium]
MSLQWHDQELVTWKRTVLFCPVCGQQGLVCTNPSPGWDGEEPEYYCPHGPHGVSLGVWPDRQTQEVAAGYARFLELEAGATPVETFDPPGTPFEEVLLNQYAEKVRATLLHPPALVTLLNTPPA